MSTRAPGFTLVEVLMTLFLLGLALAAVIPRLGRTRVSTHASAIEVAAALRQVRTQAIAEQVPVALVVPGGTRGGANSYYIVSGAQPRIISVHRLGAQHPGVRLMVGTWHLDSGQTATTSAPAGQSWETTFKVAAWGLPRPGDYAFVYTPGGRLVTNGLPNFGGSYHLVVSDGGTCQPSGAGRPCQLDEVGSPYTITLGQGGSVQVTTGLLAAARGGTEVVTQAPSGPAAAPLQPNPSPNATPVITRVSMLPDPSKLSLPTGVNDLVAQLRPLTLTIRAKSPDDVPLFCQWRTDGGGFSCSGPVRMTWNPGDGAWESTWVWRAPGTAHPGDRFRLDATVSDAYGHQASSSQQGKVQEVIQVGDPSPRIAFVSNRDGTRRVYVMNADGSGLTRLGYKWYGANYYPTWSPDGTRVAFDSVGEIGIMNADGSDCVYVAPDVQAEGPAWWSPTGAQLAFTCNGTLCVGAASQCHPRTLFSSRVKATAQWSSEARQLVFVGPPSSGLFGPLFVATVASDGSWTKNDLGEDGLKPKWSPDGASILFLGKQGGAEELRVMTLSDGTVKNLYAPPSDLSEQTWTWSPNGDQVAFSQGGDIYVIDAGGTGFGTGLKDLTGTAGPQSACDPCWTPDGAHIVFQAMPQGGAAPDIYIVDADGSRLTDLTNDDSASDVSPSVR